MGMVMNPGDILIPGKEPSLAEGVRGYDMEHEGMLYIPLVIAETPGSGAVGRYLDALPRSRTIRFPNVMNRRLMGMLYRRGFTPIIEETKDGPVDTWERGPWSAEIETTIHMRLVEQVRGSASFATSAARLKISLEQVNARLQAENTRLHSELDEFRMWLAKNLGAAGGVGAISDEPITTCLTIARARIEVLEKQISDSGWALEAGK